MLSEKHSGSTGRVGGVSHGTCKFCLELGVDNKAYSITDYLKLSA